MARNTGTGIYTIPIGTDGIPDTTIESARYNIFIHDVETDLNAPRPIIAGGTGANDVTEALINLSAEKADQLVDNYDSWIWMPGSFRSASGATNAPVAGHAFAGIVYINEPYVEPPTNANVTVSARDMNDTVVPGQVYVREKKANVWGPWAVVGAATTPFPPSGDLSATTILAAIQELDAEKASITYVDTTFAPINSPLFTGDARAPTPPVNDNDISVATTAFVSQAVANGLSAGGGSVDALAYSGIQINGAMEVSQQYGTTPVDNANGYFIDCWKANKAGPSVIRAAQLANPLGVLWGTTGFYYAVSVIATTQEPSLAAGSYVTLEQPIEGWRTTKLGWGNATAQPITIGFWSAHSTTGVYTVAVRNSVFSRSYCATYTQAVSNAWQYNKITIPGEAGSGAWGNSSNVGMLLSFTSAAGATWAAPTANTWVNGNYLAAPGQVNGIATQNSQIVITGVIVLPGTVAIPTARSALIMRPYDQELVTCQRYYQKQTSKTSGTILATGIAATATGGVFHVRFPASMRIVPALVLSHAPSEYLVLGGSGAGGPASSLVSLAGDNTNDAARVDVVTSNLVIGQALYLNTTQPGVTLAFDARL